jgi:predicted RNA-binding Zn-ribbon protein involved in translation (DUF1610 family)
MKQTEATGNELRRVFEFKKGYETDWSGEDIQDFIMDLAPVKFSGGLHTFPEDTRVTVIVEQGEATISEGKFWDWFDKNLIYCGDTHSFVHRLFDRREKWESHKDAQNDAWQIIAEMKKEFAEAKKEPEGNEVFTWTCKGCGIYLPHACQQMKCPQCGTVIFKRIEAQKEGKNGTE